MRKLAFTEEELKNLILEHKYLFKIIEITGYSKNTILYYKRKYKIESPYGFSKKSGPRKPVSEEHRKKMSERYKGDGNPFYGKKHSEETRKKMSFNHADFSGENNPLKKKLKTDSELAEKLSELSIQRWIKFKKNNTVIKSTQKKYIYEKIGSYFWIRTKNNALNRNIDFNITPQQAWDLLVKQDFKCALSGLDIDVDHAIETTASIDRKNSLLSYSIENIQWLHKNINICKSTLTNEEFINLCLLISQKYINDTSNITK